jgi:hypothetical protein
LWTLLGDLRVFQQETPTAGHYRKYKQICLDWLTIHHMLEENEDEFEKFATECPSVSSQMADVLGKELE